jgi:hypothetical protein
MNLPLGTSGLNADYCFTTPQRLALDIVGASYAVLSSTGTPWNYGNATPSVNNQSYPWLRLNSDGTPDKVYVFASGLWIARHPTPPGAVFSYEGTEASITTFDGGESAAVTPFTGPMWEKVSEMDGRSPIGPGTWSNGMVINVGDQIGEEEHAITIPELPEHHHEITGYMTAALSGGNSGAVINEKPGDVITENTTDVGEGEAMELLHPVYAIFAIRRTARLFYRV